MSLPRDREPLRWRFNDCVFDEASLELRIGGVGVEIERRPRELLRHLLRRAGEVVTKDELLDAVWPGRILSESVLAKAISRLRETCGEAEERPFIRTVYGCGYRLVAPVVIEPGAAAATAVPRHLHAAGQVSALHEARLLYRHVGLIQRYLGHYPEARGTLQRAHEILRQRIDPRSPDMQAFLGEAIELALHARNTDDFLRWNGLREQLFPDDPAAPATGAAWERAAWSGSRSVLGLLNAGRYDEAIRRARALVAAARSHAFLSDAHRADSVGTLALALAAAGRREDAMAALGEYRTLALSPAATDRYPGFVQALVDVNLAYARGDIRAGDQLLRAARQACRTAPPEAKRLPCDRPLEVFFPVRPPSGPAPPQPAGGFVEVRRS